MKHPGGTRFERRLRAQQETRAISEELAHREVERQQAERRRLSMSPAEVDDWLKRNGVLGGDRRKGDRKRR